MQTQWMYRHKHLSLIRYVKQLQNRNENQRHLAIHFLKVKQKIKMYINSLDEFHPILQQKSFLKLDLAYKTEPTQNYNDQKRIQSLVKHLRWNFLQKYITADNR